MQAWIRASRHRDAPRGDRHIKGIYRGPMELSRSRLLISCLFLHVFVTRIARDASRVGLRRFRSRDANSCPIWRSAFVESVGRRERVRAEAGGRAGEEFRNREAAGAASGGEPTAPVGPMLKCGIAP